MVFSKNVTEELKEEIMSLWLVDQRQALSVIKQKYGRSFKPRKEVCYLKVGGKFS